MKTDLLGLLPLALAALISLWNTFHHSRREQ